MKKKGIILLLIAISLLAIACGKDETADKDEITNEMLQKSIDDITIEEGITQAEMEKKLKEFTTSVLVPKSAEDMVKAVDGIKDYITENEHRSLLAQMNFNEEQTGTLRDIEIYYGNPKYTDTGQPKQIITVAVEHTDIGIMNYIIEFSINGEVKIYQHKIWVEQGF